jgi:hypothetical protein
MTIEPVNQSVIRLAYARGILGHGIKHWLKISGKAGDNTQDLARGGLLRQRVLELSGEGVRSFFYACVRFFDRARHRLRTSERR